MTSQTAAPRLTPRFVEAMAYAAGKHRTQTRKGSGIPYLGHLLSVAGYVIEADGTETEAIAGLLHDAAEDQGGEVTLGVVAVAWALAARPAPTSDAILVEAVSRMGRALQNAQ